MSVWERIVPNERGTPSPFDSYLSWMSPVSPSRRNRNKIALNENQRQLRLFMSNSQQPGQLLFPGSFAEERLRRENDLVRSSSSCLHSDLRLRSWIRGRSSDGQCGGSGAVSAALAIFVRCYRQGDDESL